MFVGAVDIALTWLAAVHTVCDDARVSGVHWHGDALIEDVALALVVFAFHLRVFPVCDDPSVELIHIIESFSHEIAAEFFTSYSASAVGEDLFALKHLAVVLDPLWKVTEGIDRW